ncbi:hypothetical protein ACHAPJ_006201 [Fusarium lateritium]
MADSPPRKRQRRDSSSATSATSEDEQEQDVFEEISPDGDVIFVFDDGTKKIHVHSFILKNASPIFSAMLGGNFKEGQMLRQAEGKQPIEIPLPYDDFDAFRSICFALQDQSHTKKHSPSYNNLVKVFEVIDKYNLVNAISLSFEFWLMNHDYKGNDMVVLWQLMLICHQVKADKPFRALSRRIVLGAPHSYLSSASKCQGRVGSLVPGSVIYKLAGEFHIFKPILRCISLLRLYHVASFEGIRRVILQKIILIINHDMYSAFHKGRSDENIYKPCLSYYRHLGEVFMQDGDNIKQSLNTVGNGSSLNGLMHQIQEFKTVRGGNDFRTESA